MDHEQKIRNKKIIGDAQKQNLQCVCEHVSYSFHQLYNSSPYPPPLCPSHGFLTYPSCFSINSIIVFRQYQRLIFSPKQDWLRHILRVLSMLDLWLRDDGSHITFSWPQLGVEILHFWGSWARKCSNDLFKGWRSGGRWFEPLSHLQGRLRKIHLDNNCNVYLNQKYVPVFAFVYNMTSLQCYFAQAVSAHNPHICIYQCCM